MSNLQASSSISESCPLPEPSERAPPRVWMDSPPRLPRSRRYLIQKWTCCLAAFFCAFITRYNGLYWGLTTKFQLNSPRLISNSHVSEPQSIPLYRLNLFFGVAKSHAPCRRDKGVTIQWKSKGGSLDFPRSLARSDRLVVCVEKERERRLK